MRPASNQRFRLTLIFYDEFACLQAIPLNGLPSPVGGERIGGTVRGKDDLLSLISDAEIDSVVQTRQIAGLGDTPVLERIFNVMPPGQIISAIEGHFAACREAEERVVLADHPLTKGERAAPPILDEIVLGSTKLSPSEGFSRLMGWFRRRALALPS
jgi:hypothetical protein